MSMRKVPRVGVTATSALVTVLAAGAFAAAPTHLAPAASGQAGPSAYVPAALPGKVQPGGPITATGTERSTVRTAFASQDSGITGKMTNVLSDNWGGYLAGRKGVKFRYIKATFFVPYLDCASTPSSYSGHWVGLDGAGSPTVEQDGILAACNGTKPQYSAWYEMFPFPPVYSTMKVSPGNSIVASVFYDTRSREFTLSVTNTTTGVRYTRVKACQAHVSCQRLSAEAISEAPSNGSSVLPLSNFRAMSFSSISVSSQTGRRGGLRAPWWNTVAVTTANAHGRIIDQPTTIAVGRAFDCYWMAAR
jgi:hypothetical protein